MSIDTNTTKKLSVPKFDRVESNSRAINGGSQSFTSLIKRVLCCQKTTEELYTCDLIIKSICCNKLTHCLFDFDCTELNKPGEAEKFMFQLFKIQNFKVTNRSFESTFDSSQKSFSMIPYTVS